MVVQTAEEMTIQPKIVVVLEDTEVIMVEDRTVEDLTEDRIAVGHTQVAPMVGVMVQILMEVTLTTSGAVHMIVGHRVAFRMATMEDHEEDMVEDKEGPMAVDHIMDRMGLPTVALTVDKHPNVVPAGTSKVVTVTGIDKGVEAIVKTEEGVLLSLVSMAELDVDMFLVVVDGVRVTVVSKAMAIINQDKLVLEAMAIKWHISNDLATVSGMVTGPVVI